MVYYTKIGFVLQNNTAAAEQLHPTAAVYLFSKLDYGAVGGVFLIVFFEVGNHDIGRQH